MKKIIFSFLILFTLSGCWNYKELNDYSIISGVAIDKVDDEYEVSVIISNSPKESSDNSSNKTSVVVYSGKGNSVVSAVKDIGKISPKELYLKSFSIVVLSEEVAKDGIKNALDFFLRYSNTGKNFYLIIAKDCKAKDTLKILTPLSNFPSQNIADNLNSTTELQGIIAKINFNDLLSILLREGINPVINAVEIKGDVDKGSNEKNLENSAPLSYTKIGNLGIFKNDKFIKWTSHNESLGINIINNRINEMFLKVNIGDEFIIVDTTSFKSSRGIYVKNNIPKIDINLSGNARIIELNGDIDLENYNTIKKLQNKTCSKIKSILKGAINLAIENKTDIFGFGLDIYRKYPNYFKKVKNGWDENLDKIKFNLNCNIVFENKMTAKNSLEDIYESEKIN